MMSPDTPIACTLEGIDREAREATVTRLLRTATTMEERADGYAFAFPPDAAPALLDFTLAERECCPFLTFAIVFPTPHERVWLELRGDAEVKAVIREMFLPNAENDVGPA